MKKTQLQHYYAATEKALRANETFLMLLNDGLTRNELKQLIKKRPNLYKRFSDWLEQLPVA